MAAGSNPAGSGAAGFDAIVRGTPFRPWTPPAMRYDGATRDWALAPDGNYGSVHPVDQAMALGVLTTQGSLKSSPNVGNTIASIQYLGGLDLQSEVEDRIRKATPIKQLLANGDAEIIRIDQQQVPGGGLKFAVYYRNLRLDINKVNSVQFYR